MNTKQWRMLKDRLAQEAPTILDTLVDEYWSKEVNDKANTMLTERAIILMEELDLPKIPPNNKLFVKMTVKQDRKPRMRIEAYHVPWKK